MTRHPAHRARPIDRASRRRRRGDLLDMAPCSLSALDSLSHVQDSRVEDGEDPLASLVPPKSTKPPTSHEDHPSNIIMHGDRNGLAVATAAIVLSVASIPGLA